MDIINQSFVDKKTGTVHTILNVVNGLALTDNIEKIPVAKLMDLSLYTQYQENTESLVVESNTNLNPKPTMNDVVDPNSFFNNAGTYNAFADKIRNIDTSKLPEDNTQPSQTFTMPSNDLGVDNSVTAAYVSTPDDEMAEVARKYGVDMNAQQSVQKQNEAFSKYIDEDEGPVVRVDADTHQVVQPVNSTPRISTAPVAQENPVHAVFRQAKRSLPFKAVVVHEGNLPRLDFIEMMEDSYEVSIIDFLADDYVSKLLSNPGELKSQIKEQIISLLDKKNGVKKIVRSKVETKPKVEVKKEVKLEKKRDIPVVLIEEAEKLPESVEKPKRSPRKNKTQA